MEANTLKRCIFQTDTSKNKRFRSLAKAKPNFRTVPPSGSRKAATSPSPRHAKQSAALKRSNITRPQHVKLLALRSRLDVDQSVHDGLEFGARPEERDVRVGLDLFGQLGVGIDHLAKQNGGAAEVTSPQAIALFL